MRHVRSTIFFLSCVLVSVGWHFETVAELTLPAEKPGGMIQLPNQWRLDPAGKGYALGLFPMNMKLSPDGKYLAVLHCGGGDHEIMVFDTRTMQRIFHTVVPNAFYGITFSKSGDRIYVSGGESEVVWIYGFEAGYLFKPKAVSLAPEKEQYVPCGVEVSPDGKLLAVAETWGNRITILDTTTTATRAQFQLEPETRPYDCKFSRDGKMLYVSLWGKASVYLVYLGGSSPEFYGKIPTGAHPNEMVLDGNGARLFVANANDNTVSVIDTITMRVVETLQTAIYPDAPEGSTPNSLTVSPDGSKLYVANADNNCLAVFDISQAGRTVPVGFIPVGWYPTSVRISPDGLTLYVANAKGFSSNANRHGPNPYWRGEQRRTLEQHVRLLLQGTLSVIPVPSSEEYPSYTARVYASSPYRPDKLPVATPPKGSPIPGRVGEPSPIKYCIYIIKENRTYDQVLGDMPEGNGDPSLCLFPEKYTPNHHALAREFVLLDNFYVEAQVSADGHEWTTGAYATDFVQKTWPSNYGGHGLSYPSEGAYPTAFPSAGYIWDKCREKGISYRSYGEFIDPPAKKGEPCTTAVESLQGHFHPFFVGWDMSIPDVERARLFIEEFRSLVVQNAWPRFIVMRLPNDHTQGSKAGALTPRAMVADNDLALGMVIEEISRSSIWKETAVFVVEDDAQNGPDHVDAHRTVAFVISPYTRGRGRDSTFYSTASMLRTMELILGLEPMSQYDAAALPMYNTFRSRPNARSYKCKPVPEELRSVRNSPDGWGADLSAKLNFEKEDAADDLLFNEIIWRSIRGASSTMPAPVRAAFVFPQGD
ncbi:MAG TPA: bifunctional YncE family protein/alkaline phosphatase family protein [Candidatus Hydrogenedentes bacterium]|nr:bifunctional YncE family protein/alkaline phosphatase family protein [Candidatus Hydrogenedentota bacterium]HPO84414.1 bifunctional YncE family protein/alkaline phosphatase family protein [Candidatus Hydrogenedentota bacterium]